MTTETGIMRRAMVEATRKDWRLWRNNIGLAYMGIPIAAKHAMTVAMLPGDVLVRKAWPVKFGVGGKGGSDLIGWRPLTITADMVGQTIAQFTAIEVKTKHGRATEEQLNFVRFVQASGGHAVFCRSPDELE